MQTLQMVQARRVCQADRPCADGTCVPAGQRFYGCGYATTEVGARGGGGGGGVGGVPGMGYTHRFCGFRKVVTKD